MNLNICFDYFLRLAAAFICGLILGYERKTKHHTVGLTTLALISVASALLSMISYIMASFSDSAEGDPTRIAAAVVTGIGFLGGGAILRQGLNIRGLTSAAVIWAACALGLACGIAQYYLVAITLLFSIIALFVLEKLENKLCPAEKSKKLSITFENHTIDIAQVQKQIALAGLYQKDFNMSESIEKEKIELIFSVKAPETFNLDILTSNLMKLGKMTKISISDD